MALNLTQVDDDEVMPVATRVGFVRSKESIEGMYDGEYTGSEKLEYQLLRNGYVLLGKEVREDGRRMKHYVRTLKGIAYQVWLSIE